MNEERARGWWLAGLLMLGVALTSCSRTPGQRAYEACRAAVLSELRAPSTATFEDFDSVKIRETDSLWILEAWVESQNALGVPLRGPFLCATNQRYEVVRGPTYDMTFTDSLPCLLREIVGETDRQEAANLWWCDYRTNAPNGQKENP